MHQQFGQYQGKNIYVIKLADFLNLSHEEKYTQEYYWLVEEDKKLILQGVVMGEVDTVNMRVHTLPNLSERVYYRKRYAQQGQEPTLGVFRTPTLDDLYNEGDNKLNSLLNESQEKLKQYTIKGKCN